MIKGTVIGPVVTPPASNATAMKSPGARNARANTIMYSTISICASVILNSIRRSDATRKSPTPAATDSTRTIFGTEGTCSARTCRSGSEMVTINPRIKLKRTISHSFFVCVIQVPTLSPIGVMDISTPSVKNIIPRSGALLPEEMQAVFPARSERS